MKIILRVGVIWVPVFLLFYGVAFSQQTYPSKPVNMVHGFTAGGNTDLSVRVLGDALSKIFNQPFVTVPKPGGGQAIAAAFVARSAPDGYTIGHYYQGVFSRVPLMQDVPYKLEDFKPVIGWQMSPIILVCRSDAPYKNLKDLLAVAKTQSVTFGHNGKATLNFVAMTILSKYAGVKLSEVPFKGDADQLAAVLGGHIQLGCVTEPAADQLLQAGKVRGLATYTKQRLAYFPDMPTFEEQGINVPICNPIGMALVPRGTPDAIVTKLHDAIKQCINDPKVKPEFAKLRQELAYMDPKEMIEYIEKEKEIYLPIFKEAGLLKQ